jgi:hypothetical protein
MARVSVSKSSILPRLAHGVVWGYLVVAFFPNLVLQTLRWLSKFPISFPQFLSHLTGAWLAAIAYKKLG